MESAESLPWGAVIQFCDACRRGVSAMDAFPLPAALSRQPSDRSSPEWFYFQFRRAMLWHTMEEACRDGNVMVLARLLGVVEAERLHHTRDLDVCMHPRCAKFILGIETGHWLGDAARSSLGQFVPVKKCARFLDVLRNAIQGEQKPFILYLLQSSALNGTRSPYSSINLRYTTAVGEACSMEKYALCDWLFERGAEERCNSDCDRPVCEGCGVVNLPDLFWTALRRVIRKDRTGCLWLERRMKALGFPLVLNKQDLEDACSAGCLDVIQWMAPMFAIGDHPATVRAALFANHVHVADWLVATAPELMPMVGVQFEDPSEIKWLVSQGHVEALEWLMGHWPPCMRVLQSWFMNAFHGAYGCSRMTRWLMHEFGARNGFCPDVYWASRAVFKLAIKMGTNPSPDEPMTMDPSFPTRHDLEVVEMLVDDKKESLLQLQLELSFRAIVTVRGLTNPKLRMFYRAVCPVMEQKGLVLDTVTTSVLESLRWYGQDAVRRMWIFMCIGRVKK